MCHSLYEEDQFKKRLLLLNAAVLCWGNRLGCHFKVFLLFSNWCQLPSRWKTSIIWHHNCQKKVTEKQTNDLIVGFKLLLTWDSDFSAEWMCSVKLMMLVSHNSTITRLLASCSVIMGFGRNRKRDTDLMHFSSCNLIGRHLWTLFLSSFTSQPLLPIYLASGHRWHDAQWLWLFMLHGWMELINPDSTLLLILVGLSHTFSSSSSQNMLKQIFCSFSFFFFI